MPRVGSSRVEAAILSPLNPFQCLLSLAQQVDVAAPYLVLLIDQGDLGLGDSTRDYYLDKEKHGKKISAYRQLLINTMAFFLEESNLPKNETKIEQDVDEIIDVETKLAKILVPDEDRRNYSELCNLRRLNDLQKLMPLVNWTRYFHSVAPYVVHDYLGSNPEILIMEIDFMRR
ncbi:hypothetical protein NECAME_09981 [Necator americanus]|uniref:Peptidase M13 N-terminal domain-containing protein n=1 Tax=Necator americanus TaxID=51031 RepID=W2TC21_NECAM|nr:hypothetical protein NECAME_09981 [Necator americanus]ETN79144.1 hypothetical protein NECAME_09981 [Necator americanus]